MLFCDFNPRVKRSACETTKRQAFYTYIHLFHLFSWYYFVFWFHIPEYCNEKSISCSFVDAQQCSAVDSHICTHRQRNSNNCNFFGCVFKIPFKTTTLKQPLLFSLNDDSVSLHLHLLHLMLARLPYNSSCCVCQFCRGFFAECHAMPLNTLCKQCMHPPLSLFFLCFELLLFHNACTSMSNYSTRI